MKPSHYGNYTLSLSSSCVVCADPVVADYCVLKGRLCLLWHGDVLFIWRDHAGLCFSQTRHNLQHSSDIVLRWPGCVLFLAEGGEEYVRVFKFQLLGFCIPFVSEQTETYLTGICSQCVFGLLSPSLRWCIGSLISVLGRSATFFMVR